MMLLGLSFSIIFSLQKGSMYIKRKYPTTPCKPVYEHYKAKQRVFQTDAINEFRDNT